MGAKCHHAEPQCFSTDISRIQRPCSASILPPYAAPLLGRSRPGLLFLRKLRKKSPVLPLQGRVKPGRYSSRHFGPAAKASGRKEPSGRPGHGRPGRWRRQCPSSRLCVRGFAPATNPCCPPQTARFRPHQRCSVLHLFECLCLFAFTLVPRSAVSAALTPLGRPGPGR